MKQAGRLRPGYIPPARIRVSDVETINGDLAADSGEVFIRFVRQGAAAHRVPVRQQFLGQP